MALLKALTAPFEANDAVLLATVLVYWPHAFSKERRMN